MIFNSLSFILFFALVYAAYRMLGHKGQNRMLLVASYFFYGWWDWRFLGLLLLSTVIDYACGLGIQHAKDDRHRRGLVALSVCANLGLLGVFKYFNFFSAGLQRLAGFAGLELHWATLNVVLPVGISFYTFQTMTYTIDIYRGRIKPTRDFLNFALYVAFFPQLVAGPIEKAASLLPQLERRRTVTRRQLNEGLWLVLWGYFKKVVMADNLAGYVDGVFARTGPVSGVACLLALYAFAFQIYGDFSGYTDIARGISKWMGIDLIVNFRFPYFVTNPRDFWRHWHISLSQWLRDYLYIPLGGSRGSSWLINRNLMITMVLGGLWHGAAWTFVAWGLYQGFVLIVHRMWSSRSTGGHHEIQRPPSPWRHAARVIFMFHVTCLGWLFFRAESMQQIGDMLYAILFRFGWSWSVFRYGAGQLLACSGLFLLIHSWLKSRDDELAVVDWKPGAQAFLMAVLFYMIILAGNFGGHEFIYFQF